MFKVSAFLGLMLLASGLWIKSLNNVIAGLQANQIVLETEVNRQNEQIRKNLEEQAKTYAQIDSLSKKNQDSMREVNALKQTFARHDLDNLALAKPKMIETRVNRASKRVFDNLVKLTDPNQFDEKEDEEVNKPD
jgi:septal ring factor EnvC (AmiA/AmiB activator)